MFEWTGFIFQNNYSDTEFFFLMYTYFWDTAVKFTLTERFDVIEQETEIFQFKYKRHLLEYCQIFINGNKMKN